MYAAVVEFKFNPGATEKAMNVLRAALPELRQLEGVKQFTAIDTGDNTGLLVVRFESQAQFEAATPKAREIMGRMADMVATPPVRTGHPVMINEMV